MTRVPLLLAGQEVGQVPIVNKDLLQHRYVRFFNIFISHYPHLCHHAVHLHPRVGAGDWSGKAISQLTACLCPWSQDCLHSI